LAIASTLLVVAPRAVRAQSAAAEALFEEGRQLMKEGDYETACPKLAESYRLDPALGALLNLALCYEEQGKSASAWAKFKDAASVAADDGDVDRKAFAERHIADLEPKLTRLKITVAPGADITGLEIRQDGVAFSVATAGTALPVDPGTHEIVATAPGHEGWSTTVQTAGAGQTAEIVIPVLPTTPPSAPPEPTAPARPIVPAPRPAPSPPDRTAGSSLSTLEILGITGMAVGGAAVVVGSVFGGLAIKNGDEVAEGCTEPDGQGSACPEASDLIGLNDEAMTQATVANVLLIGGGVVAVGSLVLYLVAPSGRTEIADGVSLSPRPDGVLLRF
jgi:hypothetical protein